MLRDKARVRARPGKDACLDSSLTLWRGEGLSLLLAPAYRVDVGTAGITPETQEYVIVPGELGRAEPAVPQHGTRGFLSLLPGEREMAD